MDATFASEWIEKLRLAWVEGNSEEAAGLFTTDATYRSHPFKTPLQGRVAIASYWSASTASQTDLEVRFGDALVDADRVAVEWWANVTEGGRPQTDCGALILKFQAAPGGGWLCSELREYWNLSDGHLSPPKRWGA